MHVIITYDVKAKRTHKIHKYLKTKLFWVQNSVFQGSVTKSEKDEIFSSLEKMTKDEDSILFFVLSSEKSLSKEVIGEEKNQIDNII